MHPPRPALENMSIPALIISVPPVRSLEAPAAPPPLPGGMESREQSSTRDCCCERAAGTFHLQRQCCWQPGTGWARSAASPQPNEANVWSGQRPGHGSDAPPHAPRTKAGVAWACAGTKPERESTCLPAAPLYHAVCTYYLCKSGTARGMLQQHTTHYGSIHGVEATQAEQPLRAPSGAA